MPDYSKKGHYYIAEARFELNKLVALIPKNASVLDIGAGNGNNTRFFLEKGLSVTAVEPNPEAIKDLRLLQKEHPKSLKIVKASLDNYQPAEKFDVIICCMVVHFIEGRKAGLEAIKKIQIWTNPSGVNLITGYMYNQPLSNDYTFLFKPGELKKQYEKWEIYWSEESYRLTFSRIYTLKDVLRLLIGRRGFKAARIIATKNY